ncbi:MAG: matrixin family metalloprotease [Deltaproteobacteria bacterium]|nr:matrixin family metalloprotease [Deltaproteobacteria bacterium]
MNKILFILTLFHSLTIFAQEPLSLNDQSLIDIEAPDISDLQITDDSLSIRVIDQSPIIYLALITNEKNEYRFLKPIKRDRDIFTFANPSKDNFYFLAIDSSENKLYYDSELSPQLSLPSLTKSTKESVPATINYMPEFGAHIVPYRIVIPFVAAVDDLVAREAAHARMLKAREVIRRAIYLLGRTLTNSNYKGLIDLEISADLYRIDPPQIGDEQDRYGVIQVPSSLNQQNLQWLDFHLRLDELEEIMGDTLKTEDVLTFVVSDVDNSLANLIRKFVAGELDNISRSEILRVSSFVRGTADDKTGLIHLALKFIDSQILTSKGDDDDMNYSVLINQVIDDPQVPLVAAHEIGHILSLAHVYDERNLMFPIINDENILLPRQLKAIAAVLYGEPSDGVTFSAIGDAFINPFSNDSQGDYWIKSALGFCGDGKIGQRQSQSLLVSYSQSEPQTVNDEDIEECDIHLSYTDAANKNRYCVDPTIPIPYLSSKVCVDCRCVEVDPDPSQSKDPRMVAIVIPNDSKNGSDDSKVAPSTTPLDGPIPPGSGGACDPTQVGINGGCTVDTDCNNGIGQRCNSDCRCECLSGLPPCAGDDECILGQPFAISCDPLTGCCADAVIFE